MELIFIRHGQGEHNLNVPDRLSIGHPSLTQRGREQVRNLAFEFTFDNQDLFIVSPTKRTIETANILTESLSAPKKYISPLVGPRVFPLYTHSTTAKCDIALSIERIVREYPDFDLIDAADEFLWHEGINTIEENKFRQLGNQMLNWIRTQNVSRAFIIAHDGTITNYRQLLGEQGLTREDFLGEAGTYRVILG
jgi:broad specificity phosphatase PhoE